MGTRYGRLLLIAAVVVGASCSLGACEDSLAGNSQRAQSQHATQPQQVASQPTVLKIGCKPASHVFIDGEYKGLSPLKVNVMPGIYEVQFVHPEKGEFTREVTVTEMGLLLMHQWP